MQYSQLFLALLLAVVLLQLGAAIDIHVDKEHGTSNTTCCPSSSGSSSTPCESLTLALECVVSISLTTPVSLIVSEGEYTLTNDSRLTVIEDRTGGFTITGNCYTSAPCVNITCDNGAGLSFIKSNDIKLENLVFASCGFPNNSTSKDFSYDYPQFQEVSSTLYFLLCRTVTISNVTVQETEGTGVVMYSTVGDNTITNSNFIANKPLMLNDSATVSGGGGVYIEFAYCYPGNTSCFNGPPNIPDEYTRDSNYTISDCIIADNVANVSDSSQMTFVLVQKWDHLAFGRGGGLSLFFKGSATNNTVSIESSEFMSNTALWGGGLLIEMQDNSSNNSVSVSNSILSDNECLFKKNSSKGTGGGGARIGYIFFKDTHVKYNSILFISCSFLRNSAFFGGGLSFNAAREPTESSSTNSLVFLNTTWEENIARAGSGADLSVWHTEPRGAVATVNFTDCCFKKNSGSYTKKQSTVVGIGAMYLDSIPVYFMGENFFLSNVHSAIAAVTTGIYITTNSTLSLSNNKGRYGGAVALLGAAFIQMYPSSRVEFINNTAAFEGGAIYEISTGNHDLINSRNCFIRYSDFALTPKQWNSEFFFSGNTANGRQESIFASSLLICQWGGAYANASDDLLHVFCWSNNWDYDGGNCTTEVRTSPAKLESKSNYKLEVFPGVRHPTLLTMWDDRRSDVTSSTVFLTRSLSKGIHIDASSTYISSNYISLHADTSEGKVSGEVLLETIDPRVVQVKLNVTILQCPPGMFLPDGDNYSTCQCGDSYNGVIKCDATHFQTKIQQGNWIGLYNHGGVQRMVASRTPYFNTSSNKLYVKLPRKADKLNEKLCGSIHRTGTLCGKCVHGYGPSIHTLECIQCKESYKSILEYLASQYILLTVMFAAVAVLDIRFTSARLNAFIFFAQVLPIVFTLDGGGAITLNHSGDKFKDFYTSVYNIWNLKFFFGVPLCLSSHLSSSHVISIWYAEASYPLILIGIARVFIWLYENGYRCVMCFCRPLHTRIARLQRYLNIERSLAHTFASFILLSYSRFILVSFLLLTTTPLVKENGEVFGHVVFYDGTIPYFSKQHALFFGLSLVALFIFAIVTPLLLIIPSFSRNLTIVRRRWPKSKRFTPDLDRCAIQPNSRQCTLKFNQCVINNWPKVIAFLEAFHGCYKDGTSENEHGIEFDYRWFAGFYLILRICLFGVYAFTSDWLEQYSFLQLVCFIGLLALLFLRPYKDDYYNKLDAGMFALLLGINTLTMYNYGKTVISSKQSIIASVVQYILVLIPLIYIVFVFLKYIWTKCAEKRKHTYKLNVNAYDDDGQDFIENADFYRRNTYLSARKCSESSNKDSTTSPSSLRNDYEQIEGRSVESVLLTERQRSHQDEKVPLVEDGKEGKSK